MQVCLSAASIHLRRAASYPWRSVITSCSEKSFCLTCANFFPMDELHSLRRDHKEGERSKRFPLKRTDTGQR